MKKGLKLFFGALLGVFTVGGAVLALNHNNFTTVYAEEEANFECTVEIGAFEHGEVTVDRTEGFIGEVVTVTVKHDLFYVVDYVKVNDVNLVESETTSGLYTFTLVEGVNKLSVNFVVDQELLGTFSTMYEQASNKDWTNLFSLKNVITIVSFVLNSGILIYIIRYFVKDKKLAEKIEKGVTEKFEEIIPEKTKEAVIKQTEEVLTPVFANISGYQEEIIRVLGCLTKCMALMQENTPESRRAVLEELSNLNIGDISVIESAKAIIEEFANNKKKEVEDLIEELINIKSTEEPKEEPKIEEHLNEEKEKEEDGTQI